MPEPRYFLEEIFQHFGNVTHITSDSFEVLYKTLNLGTDEENDDSGEDEHHEDGEQGGHHRHKRSVEFNKVRSVMPLEKRSILLRILFTLPRLSFKIRQV